MAVASRLGMVVLLGELPSARDDGLGQSAAAVSRAAYIPGAVLSVALLAPLGIWALLAAVVGLAALCLVARRALRRVGGQTGDVLGAAQKMSETAGLIALSLG